MAEAGAVLREQSVLHISGLLDHLALAPLKVTKAGLGSMHPLQTLADPATAVERLQGVYAMIEGDEPALQQAERLARSLKMIPIRIEASAKPRYHAAASLVANYTTVLGAIAERVAREAERSSRDDARGRLLSVDGGAEARFAAEPEEERDE